MRCIAVINQKGGCGKTTVATNLSACLAVQGRRTLLVDMDPQSHCAVGLAVPEDQIERNIYDVLISVRNGSVTELKSIVWQISQNFDLAPSGIELAALEPQLAGQDHREDCLREVLQSSAQGYDFVVVDCPPSVGLLTFNALRSADEVIIPVETGYFALHGLARQLETLKVLKQQCRQEIQVRILPTMYDVRTKLAREVMSELKKQYGKNYPTFTLNILRFPSFQSPLVLPDELRMMYADELDIWLENNAHDHRLHQMEINQVQRLIDYLDVVKTPHSDTFDMPSLHNDFKKFYKQYDERRGKNIVDTFEHIGVWYSTL